MRWLPCLGLLLLCALGFAQATVTVQASTFSTSNLTTYTTASFTPTNGDLLIAIVDVDGPDGTGVSDSLGGTWTALYDDTATSGRSVYYRTAFSNGSAMTFSVTSSPAAAGCNIVIKSVTGTSGAAPVNTIVQSANGSFSGGGTPAVTFGASLTAANCVIGAVFNTSNPAGVTEPSGYTETIDSGHATNNQGLETCYKSASLSGTTVTWGSTSATTGVAFAVEVKAATAARVPQLPTVGVGLGASRSNRDQRHVHGSSHLRASSCSVVSFIYLLFDLPKYVGKVSV